MIDQTDSTARQILEVIPAIMRVIRKEMRSQRTADLTVPEFRALLHIQQNPGCSLLAVADHVGLTSPTVSKMLDGLVENGLVNRQISHSDRRKVILTLTAHGQSIITVARDGTLAHLESILAPLSHSERLTVCQTMNLLRPLFLKQFYSEKMVLEGNGRS